MILSTYVFDLGNNAYYVRGKRNMGPKKSPIHVVNIGDIDIERI